MTTPAIKPLCAPICPRCGSRNACAPAAAGTFDIECWCSTVTMREDAVAGLPAAAIGRACLCRPCLERADNAPTDKA